MRRWSGALAVALVVALGYYFSFPRIRLDVSVADVIYPGDRITIRAEGAPYTILCRCNPDGGIDVLAEQSGDVLVDTICPVTNTAGQTIVVAMGFDAPVDTSTLEWHRMIRDVTDTRLAEEWREAHAANGAIVRVFDTPIEYRPILKLSTNDIQHAVKLCRGLMLLEDYESTKRLVRHLLQCKPASERFSFQDGLSLSWMSLVAGMDQLVAEILGRTNVESREHEAATKLILGFTRLRQNQLEMAMVAFQEAVSATEQLKGESMSPDARFIRDCCAGFLGLIEFSIGDPMDAVENLKRIANEPSFSGSTSHGSFLVRTLIAAYEEAGNVNEARSVAKLYAEDSVEGFDAMATWTISFGDVVAKERLFRERPGEITLGIDTIFGAVFGHEDRRREDSRSSELTVPLLQARSNVDMAEIEIFRQRPKEARQLLDKAMQLFDLVNYRGVYYGDAMQMLVQCTSHSPLERVHAANLSLELEKSARYSTPFRVAECYYLLAIASASAGQDYCESLKRVIEYASKSSSYKSGTLQASAYLLASHCAKSEAEQEARLIDGLGIAAREMLRDDRLQVISDAAQWSLAHFLSHSKLADNELYEAIKSFRARTVDGAEPWRDPKSALVDIFFYKRMDGHFSVPGTKIEPRYVAFVTGHEGQVTRVELGDARAMDTAIRQWREAMSKRLEEECRTHGQAVAKLLWKPLEPLLSDKLNTLYICADWEVGAVPWEAIPVETAPRATQIIDRFHVERLAASRSKRLNRALQLAAQKDAGVTPLDGRITVAKPAAPLDETETKVVSDARDGTPLLLVGDVDYGARLQVERDDEQRTSPGNAPIGVVRMPWRPLQGTQRELEIIEQMADSPSNILRGEQANKAEVLERLPHCRIAHFATHAFANADWHSLGPRETGGAADHFGLALAGANWSTKHGLLTATEVSRMKLPHLQLAVLSGCETGVGRPVRNQYLSTLHRAFHQAGAPHVLASMWRVDDLAAQQMMAKFYKHYFGNPKRRPTPSRALRAAQLDMRGGVPALRPPKERLALDPNPSHSVDSPSSRGPDFEKGPQPMTAGKPSNRRAPDWAWAAWYVSNLSFNNRQ